jgi:hypothetical protein
MAEKVIIKYTADLKGVSLNVGGSHTIDFKDGSLIRLVACPTGDYVQVLDQRC